MSFYELALRWFDGRATPEEQAVLWAGVTQDESLAAEFASIARFEHALGHRLRAQSKALLEFVALESAMADEAVPEPAPVIIVPSKKWRPPPALRIAAMAAAAVLLGVLIQHWQPGRPKLAEPVVADVPGTSSLPQVTTHSTAPTDTTLMRPRHDPAAPFATGIATTASTLPARPLAERMEDFYLPEVTLDHVTFAQAAKWLTDQARALNYLKRPDLENLRMIVPSTAQDRTVTLISGPISFSKAVAILSHLATCQATITDSGITIADRATMNALRTPQAIAAASPQTRPPGKEEIIADAKSLGIPVTPDSVQVDPRSNVAAITATPEQAEAIRTLQASRRQLDEMAPLTFMPVVLPPGFTKTDRVLSASESEALRQQVLAATPNPPRITVPRQTSRAATTPTAVPAASLSVPLDARALQLTSVPMGEMEVLRLGTIPTSPTLIAAPPQQQPPASGTNGSGNEQIVASTGSTPPAQQTSTSTTLGEGEGIVVVTTNEMVLMYADDGTPYYAPANSTLALAASP